MKGNQISNRAEHALNVLDALLQGRKVRYLTLGKSWDIVATEVAATKLFTEEPAYFVDECFGQGDGN